MADRDGDRAGTPPGRPVPAPAEVASQPNRAVPMAAVAISLASLAVGFVSYRENRLAAAIPHHLWSVVPLAGFLAFLALLAGILAATGRAAGRDTRHRPPWPALARGLLAGGLIVAVFLLCEAAALRLAGAPGSLARISVGPGAWLSALAGYVVILDAARELRPRPGLRLAVSAAPVAALAVLAVAGSFRALSLAQELAVREEALSSQLAGHLALSFGATGLAIVIGVPLGIIAFRRRRAERPVFLAVNVAQTIPSLALFGLLIAPLAALSHRFPLVRQLGIEGIGPAPAVIALTLYALLPIARTTHAGLRSLDRAVLEAGRGMGMSRRQLLATVEVPLALPVVLGGVRTALVQAIGNTAIAALIGAGGLGIVIFQGLGQAAPDLILLGTIPVIALAVAADRLMQGLVYLATRRGLRGAGVGPA